MSNVLHGNCNYFQVPQELLSAGTLSAMNASDLKLYLALLYEAQRTTSTEIRLSGPKLAGMTAISPGSATDARRRLAARGLVSARRALGNAYVYHLLEPISCEPMRNLKRENAKQGAGSAHRGAGWIYDLSTEQYELYYRSRLKSAVISETKNGLQATCPFHADTKPSLSIATRKGVWNCRGCGKGGGMIQFEQAIQDVDAATAVGNIAAIVGIDLAKVNPYREPEATYSYCDEEGELLYEVLRYPGKDFRARRPNPNTGGWLPNVEDVRRVMYHLPEIEDASQVVIVEGEKDADAIAELQLRARDGSEVIGTTNPFGAGQWRDEYSVSLRDKDVVVIPDMDERGLRHAGEVCRSLRQVGASVRQVNLPVDTGVKDVSDYLHQFEEADLIELIGAEWFAAENFVEA